MKKAETRRIDVSVDSPAGRDRDLSLAVEDLLPLAFERRQGILVTRYSGREYSVEVSSSVSYGLIMENRC